MCLHTKQYFKKYAKEDVKVYKCLIIDGDKLITPYQMCDVKLNSLMIPANKMELLYEDHFTKYTLKHFILSVFGLRSKNKIITRGAIHSYKNSEPEYYWYKVFEEYVPKGAWYYEGDNGNIASEKLFVTDKQVNI